MKLPTPSLKPWTAYLLILAFVALTLCFAAPAVRFIYIDF